MRDTGEERRNFVRERTHIEVEVVKDFKHSKAIMEYISFGGAFVSLPKTFPKDSVIKITFDIPGEYSPFQADAKVVWVHKDKAMGVEFFNLPESEKLKLEKFLIG
jgi:Tfp pilus assembly protein PilZ